MAMSGAVVDILLRVFYRISDGFIRLFL